MAMISRTWRSPLRFTIIAITMDRIMATICSAMPSSIYPDAQKIGGSELVEIRVRGWVVLVSRSQLPTTRMVPHALAALREFLGVAAVAAVHLDVLDVVFGRGFVGDALFPHFSSLHQKNFVM